MFPQQGGGGAAGAGGAGGQPPWLPPPKSREEKAMIAITESCVFKGGLAGVAGGGLGFMLGFAFAGYDSAVTEVKGFWPQVKASAKASVQKGVSLGKNFGVLGAIFATSECVLDKVRAKHDIYNGLMAGCFTGAVISRQGGTQAMGLGCVGMAAFSVVIDAVMHR